MSFQNLSIVDYRNQYFQQAEHTLVDVRTTMEFRQGHVPGAINMPLDELLDKANTLNKTQPIIVICASGNRSRAGAQALKQMGFDEVYNFQGGTMVWMMNGLPLDR